MPAHVRIQAKRERVSMCVKVTIALVFILGVDTDGDGKDEEYDCNYNRVEMYGKDKNISKTGERL